MSHVLATSRLRALIDGWLHDGKRVAGPQRVQMPLVQYGWLKSSEALVLDGFIHPANSIKEFVFPQTEILYGYTVKGKQIELVPRELPTTEQIILAARPCDAAALPILDAVFNWDFKDELYNRRRELSTVVTLACKAHDAQCFCTSVGLGPDNTRGSDAMLIEIEPDRYEVRILTPRGERLLANQTETSDLVGKTPPGPPEQFDLAAVGEFLAQGYDRPEWQTTTLRCLGCAACAYTCPTCHCFDMVDEGTAKGGVRRRHWDACQFSKFTLHASGHNPRNVQAQRQRQRVFHKFQTYPEKFGDVLCTGCGNCSRNCPVSLGMLAVLKQVAAKTDK